MIPALTAWRNSAFDLRREITATAEAIARVFRERAGSLFGRVNVHLLTDEVLPALNGRR